MEIESLTIQDVGGISSLKLEKLNPHLNIICGENGIGKTNIIESVTACFTRYSQNKLKKKADSNRGLVKLSITNIDEEFKKIEYIVDSFYPRENNNHNNHLNLYQFWKNYSKFLMYFKVDRFFSYQPIDSLKIYDNKDEHTDQNLNGVSRNNLKDWFIINEFLSKQEYAVEVNKKNIGYAKEAIALLNYNYSFSSIKQDMEIYINSPTGEIPYEYLSSGFKSCLFIIWGIIREIQIRFPDIDAKKFNGIIIIDEIELHLHPEWQNKICNVLKRAFPNTQFIVTTHSPHVIQTAEHNQVIALEGINGILNKKDLESARNGFNGWSIEEILTDVMGMRDLRTEWYRLTLSKFNTALDEENVESAKAIFSELETRLHPQSTELTLFRFQLKALTGE
ncbi:AAA family ATPase [Aggregatibacter sp. Marseille-P9115]|jgi:predicted ATP-binding protein involved in virulence|uniref:AAA family ATPase n=1 Tax=Aggregatibacter sp. Marseille-P9115 TaxID=2866570 RepID=UPI001E5CCD96|nr:AAA family ATPase [Aggregatibacter sp. Marseille-P9115]